MFPRQNVPLLRRVLFDARYLLGKGIPAGLDPHMQKLVGSKPIPRPVRRLVLDRVDANGIFEDHAIRPREVKEKRAPDVGWRPGPNTIGTRCSLRK